jgi:glycolate oxidase iron-sulfur subunit
MQAPALAQDNEAVAAAGDVRKRIMALADQCVMCGLCQPQCPTYHVARNEAESPRGRIALAKSLALGKLDATATASAIVHLDQCLTCMNCERVCPSQVQYGELIVTTRQLLSETQRTTIGGRALQVLTARPRLFRAGLRVANLPGLRTFIRSRIVEKALRPLGLDRIARELPRLPALPRVSRGRGRGSAAPARARVGLFLGCAAALIDRDVHAAAIVLLQALGYDVVLPRGHGCCGALALHAGEVERADALAAPTRRAFADAGVDTVLVSASGCFGTLRDVTFAGTPIRTREIHEFLAADERFGNLRFRPLARRIALHTPCTQANVARAGAAIRALLEKIPSVEIVALPDEPRCCGAAGDYFLKHAGIADRLRAEKLDQTSAIAPDLLVTSNVGCRTFLENGLRKRNSAVAVVHPVALLAQQLEN